MNVVTRHWKDRVTKNVIINTIGNYLGVVLGGLYTIFLVRFFSPYDFGVLSILLAISYLLANILNFGIPAALYSYIPTLLPDRKKTFDFLKTNFLFQTSLASFFLILIYFILPRIDFQLYKLDLPPYYYALTMVSTLMFIWQNFVRDALNAAQKFFHSNAVGSISNVARFVLLIAMGLMGKLDIANAIIILGIIGPAVLFVMVLLERKWLLQSLLTRTVDRAHIKLSFTMTYFLSTQLFNLTTRADLFLIAFFLTPIDAGYYSLAQRMIFVILTSIDSITQVLSPEFSKISSRTEVYRLLKKALYYMSIPSLVLITLFLMPDAVYRLAFTAQYEPSIHLVKWLSLMYIPYAFDAAFLLFFLYTLKKPSFVLYINVVMLLAVNIFHLVFIPRLGVQGPVISFGVTYLLVTVIIVSTLIREIRLLKN